MFIVSSLKPLNPRSSTQTSHTSTAALNTASAKHQPLERRWGPNEHAAARDTQQLRRLPRTHLPLSTFMFTIPTYVHCLAAPPIKKIDDCGVAALPDLAGILGVETKCSSALMRTSASSARATRSSCMRMCARPPMALMPLPKDCQGATLPPAAQPCLPWTASRQTDWPAAALGCAPGHMPRTTRAAPTGASPRGRGPAYESE